MSRPSQAAGNGTTTTQTTPPQQHVWKQPLAELLLANLRLLDFDTRNDWPDISSKTFSTKDTQQNQKQRIKCTEWILYRLFELWDPEETKDKLQPFFPPLEPLQSLNLRGALFRSLNELKKNGVLGRESVLRKTMLDECKGEKLMELLVIFSTMVLRRVDAGKGQARTRSVAEKTAVAPTLSQSQTSSLIPLSIAHAGSLGNILRKREEKRQRYKHFNELLNGKRTQLRQRVKVSVQHKRRESNVNEDMQIKKVVQDNWTGGSSKWSSALLTGDDTNAGDMPLQKPFEEVWNAVNEGKALGGDAKNLGLLAALDRRVQVQKERLQMWREFHEGLRDPDSHVREPTKTTPTTSFKFDRHQTLQLGSSRSSKDVAPINNAYESILSTLRSDISNASKSRRMGGAGWTAKTEGTTEYRSHDLFSPVKGSAMDTAPLRTHTFSKPQRMANIMDDKPSLLAPTSKPELSGFKIKRLGRADSKTDTSLPPKPEPAKPSGPFDKQEERPATPEMETPIKITEPSPLRQEEEPTAADRIISSVVDATPSPAKQNMSLTERTRMSMAYFNKGEPASIDSGLGMPIDASPSPSDDDTLPLPGEGNVQRRVSLLERTRLSMAAVPAHQPLKSRKSLKVKRESLFPVNQFETPGRPRRLPEPKRDATPTEKLFSDEAEYESVFKARPRVALSPVPFTPEVDGEGSAGELEDDEGSDTEVGGGIASSPLVGRRRVVVG